jgi:hypothetical protein
MKDQVRRLEGDLDELREAVRAEQVALGRLKTEWAMLNQPGRVARLASTYIGLRPAQPGQIVRIEDIPLRADLDLAGRSLQVVLPSGQGASLRLKPRPSLLSHPGLGISPGGAHSLNAESDSE